MLVEFTCEICGNECKKYKATTQTMPRFCSNVCKFAFQGKDKPSKEWLEQKYLVEGLDCTAISKLVSRDPKSVWGWMKEFGIPTRKRGTTGNWVYAIGVPRMMTEEGRAKLSAQAKAARARDGHVPYLKNGVHHLKGKRGADTPNWKGGITPERQAFYDTDEWKEAVKAVWKRDNATCQRCRKHHDTPEHRGTFHIHHITSFMVAELRCEVSNLVLLCNTCHRWVHSRKNTERRFLGDDASDKPTNS